MTAAQSRKLKIAFATLELFARRGYAETRMREIAAVTGTTEAFLQKHFESKSAILDYILEHCIDMGVHRINDDRINSLTKDATTDDVLKCFNIYFPEENEIYYFQSLDLLYKEKFRNNSVKEYFAETKILWQQNYVARMLTRLIDLGALTQDTDIEFWSQLHIGITHLATTRYLLGIGDRLPHFKGKCMEDNLRTMYDTIFILHGTSAGKPCGRADEKGTCRPGG